jgi:hypothetical protein
MNCVSDGLKPPRSRGDHSGQNGCTHPRRVDCAVKSDLVRFDSVVSELTAQIAANSNREVPAAASCRIWPRAAR